MGMVESYKDLITWQKGMDLVERIYRLSRLFPQDERFGLTSQLKRASVSIPSNIAEGHARSTRQEYARFLDVARGSANEVETQLLIAKRLAFSDENELHEAVSATNEIQRILLGLMRSLRKAK